MQVQLVTIAHEQPPWCGELWHIIHSVITREWYITVAAQQFLFQTPQVLSRTVYLCRNFDMLLCRISEEERLEELLFKSGADLSSQQLAHWQAEDRRIRDERYALQLLSEMGHCSHWTQESFPDADWKRNQVLYRKVLLISPSLHERDS